MAGIQTSLGNYFGKLVRASRGIFITNTNLDSQTDWIEWEAAFDPSTQTVDPTSQSVKYRKIADKVYLNINLEFTYTPPGADTNTVTITGFPVQAAGGAKYSNLCNIDGPLITGDFCIARIDPAISSVALDIINSNPLVSGQVYTVEAQLVYKS